ncbi:MAG: hypothetical protein R3B72_13430 [Polyangiaceae bacterium]
MFRTTLALVPVLGLAFAVACSGSDQNSSTSGNPSGSGAGSSSGGSSAGGSGEGAGELVGGSTSIGSGGQGGSGGEDTYECGQVASQASLEALPADIIVAVDNSDSMALEASQVKAQINAMVGALTATGIDAHVIMISKGSDNFIFDPLDTGVCAPAPLGSGNCPEDENLPAYRHVFQEVASNDALQIILDTYDQWKTSLRPNATKTFLVVSDDDSDMTASQFTAGLAALSPAITTFKFNAIVASEAPFTCAVCALSNCQACANPCCDTSLACIPISIAKGQTYLDLQNQTMGVFGDLCTQSFQPVFADMATEVINHTPISCTFEIPPPPNGQLVPGKTNVDYKPNGQSTPQTIFNVPGPNDCTINGGWYFDDNQNPTSITLCESTCNAVKASTEGEVRVTFDCTTQTQPS